MSSVGEERRWLQDILLSDSSDSSASGSDTDSQITEDDFQEMLKFHILRKKYQGRFYQKPEVKIINIIKHYYSNSNINVIRHYYRISSNIIIFRIYNINIIVLAYYRITIDF